MRERGPTIYEALKAKLGRDPSHAELVDEVKRILREASEERLAELLKRCSNT